MKKICLIGHYPPPIGGISIHIKKIYENLCNKYEIFIIDPHNDHKNNELNYLYGVRRSVIGLFKLLNKIINIRPDILHFHVSSMNNFYITYILFQLFNRSKKIITIHGGSFPLDYKSYFIFKRVILLILLKLTNCIIVVGSEQYFFLVNDLNIEKSKINLIPAFLPNKINESFNDINNLFEQFKNRSKILLVVGSLEEHYGIHLVVDACNKLQKVTNFNLLLVTYNSENSEKIDPLYKRTIMNELNKIKNSAHVNDLQSEMFTYLLSKIDILIRPTFWDGDSITLREAASMGKQIIASNSVKRPEGVLLFESKNAKSLELKIFEALEDDKKGIVTEHSNNLEPLINIYNTI